MTSARVYITKRTHNIIDEKTLHTMQTRKKFWSYYDRGADYCDGRVCLSLCSPGRDHIFGTTCPIFTNFLCLLPTAVAQSSSGGVVICYVFPVLRMTSYLHIPVSWGCSTLPPAWGSEAHRQPWAWRVGIPVAGSGRSGLLLAVAIYYRPQWTCWIFMTSCLHLMSLRVIATSKWRELTVAPGGNTEVYDCLDGCCKCMQSVILCVFAVETGISTGNESVLNVWANSTINLVFLKLQ